MKKLLFIIFVCSTLFAGESLKETLLGYNNPNGRTGMITMQLPSKSTLKIEGLETTTTFYYAMLPLTDFVTIEFLRTKTEMSEAVTTQLGYDNSYKNDAFNFYFHIPLNKLLEDVFESY